MRRAPSLQVRLQAKPESALILRERLGLWLDELGANDDEIYDLSLATSEAFINAVEHPHEPSADMVDVEGSLSDHTVSIAIHDFGSWRQVPQHENGGYGFPMMRRLVDAVEVNAGSNGTCVTLRLQIAGRSLDEGDADAPGR